MLGAPAENHIGMRGKAQRPASSRSRAACGQVVQALSSAPSRLEVWARDLEGGPSVRSCLICLFIFMASSASGRLPLLFLGLFGLFTGVSADSQSPQSSQSPPSVMRRAGVAEAGRLSPKPLMRSQREPGPEPAEPAEPVLKPTVSASSRTLRRPLFDSLAESEDLDLDGCGLAPWSSWSVCSCGGRRLRTRDAFGLLEEQLQGGPGPGALTRFSGELLVKAPGRYLFQWPEQWPLQRLQVGAALRASNATTRWVRYLAKGAHSLVVEAEKPPGSSAGLPLQYRGPDTQEEPILLPRSVLRHGAGKGCEARAVEAGRCPACAVDCEWNDWADWSKCVASTAPCGRGQETRSRSVQRRAASGEKPSLLEGGRACEGQGVEQRSCHVNCARTFW
ncbi:HMCN1 [Symbiodinium microadriaticum]|nr:HMCN1 [Symbiodinium microadriaticum]